MSTAESSGRARRPCVRAPPVRPRARGAVDDQRGERFRTSGGASNTNGSASRRRRAAVGDRGRVDEQRARARILDDVLHLVERLSGVDRDGHATGEEDAEVVTIQSTRLGDINATRSPGANPRSRNAAAIAAARSNTTVDPSADHSPLASARAGAAGRGPRARPARDRPASAAPVRRKILLHPVA